MTSLVVNMSDDEVAALESELPEHDGSGSEDNDRAEDLELEDLLEEGPELRLPSLSGDTNNVDLDH